MVFCISINGNAESKNEFGMPEWWGELSDSRLMNSECPDLNGRYSDIGDLYEYQNGLPTGQSQNGNAEIKASNDLNFNKKILSESTINSANESFIVIVQDKNTVSIFKPKWENHRVIEEYQFSVEKKEYECNQGWISFKLEQSTVGAESRHINFKTKVNLTKLKNGSLVSYTHQKIKNTSIWKLGFGESNEREVFSKYPPVMINGNN